MPTNRIMKHLDIIKYISFPASLAGQTLQRIRSRFYKAKRLCTRFVMVITTETLQQLVHRKLLMLVCFCRFLMLSSTCFPTTSVQFKCWRQICSLTWAGFLSLPLSCVFMLISSSQVWMPENVGRQWPLLVVLALIHARSWPLANGRYCWNNYLIWLKRN